MQQQMKKKSQRNLLLACIIVLFIICVSFVSVYIDYPSVFAEQNNNVNSETVIYKDEKDIAVTSYLLDDNSGYYESQDKRGHALNRNLINLSVCAQSEISQPEVQTGTVSGYRAYGISGQSVAIRLSYNYANPDNLLGTSNDIFSISSDTFTSVGDFKDIGVIGKGAMLFQKKSSPNETWQWQTKDGETKKQLHTFDFTELAELNDYYNTDDKYILYTPSGTDLSKGVYIKITFAYELKRTIKDRQKNRWGIWEDVTITKYDNIIETAEFYIVQNSGAVLFHNASNFGQVGEESESGAFSIDKFDTILDGDVTLNGFRLDTLGVDAYDITYKRNNEAVSHTACDGQFFLEQGRYDFSIRTKLGKVIKHTIFVDRREVNDAVIGYFGQNLFTQDSKRIYSTGQYPTYLAGAKYHLNATDGTVSPIVGKLYRITENDEVVEEHFVKDIVPVRRNGYATEELSSSITDAGLYKAEFWNNAKCLKDNSELSGDIYHFVFRFRIVEAGTGVEPSINQAYLNGLIGFSDLKSKYFAVSTPTKGNGNAIFAFADYGSAYDFAYELERETVKSTDNRYEYNGETYRSQYDVLNAIDTATKNRVTVRYFDATDPKSYQTADIGGAKLSDLNYDHDIIVFTNDLEQAYLKVDLPFLNNRKFRYIMSADAGLNSESQISEGTLPFAFIKTDDFETQSVTLTLADDPNVRFDIVYGVSVEYQLGLSNAPSGIYKVFEHNANNGDSEYEAVYIRPGDMTSSVNVALYSDGEFTERIFDGNDLGTVRNVSGFMIDSITNELDPYGILKVTHSGKTEICSISEASNKLFSDGGAYDINVVDRLGNEMRFTIVISQPVGVASVHLQLDDNIDDIQTEYNVFVGQEIDLPIITAASELYAFDGWLYDDMLITDGKFTPTKSGDIYIWAQFTQKYTYLNFDSDGGAPIEQIKAEIGKELHLPATTKDGWRFGGWNYGGKVYTDSYIPTTSSPTFVAVWNFIKTDIELYDGNLVDSITANVGDKVILPFPTRTGYTFFGWRLDLDNGQNKIYYGQITKLENVDAMRLDALWIHNSDVEKTALSQGNGGRTAVYFIDGTLLENDTIEASIGTSIALPTPSRAGYTFVGWTWRNTAISGKIYVGKTMTVPQNSDGKIVLEALWTAREVNSGAYVSGSIKENSTGSGLLTAISDFVAREPIALTCIILSVIVALIICVKLSKKKALFMPTKRSPSSAYIGVVDTPVSENGNLAARQNEYRAKMNKPQRIKAFISGFRLNPLSSTVCIALFMTVIMALTGVLGSWGRSTVAIAQTVQAVTFDQNQTVENTAIGRELGGNFTVDADRSYREEEIKISYSQEDISVYMDSVEKSQQTGLDITDEEAFLYSIIILDMFSFGYNAFPATAALYDGRVLYGIAYSDYSTKCLHEDTNIEYIGAGFIAACNQPDITEDLIKQGVVIKSSNENTESDDSLYMLTQADAYGPKHYIADNKYIVYSVDGTQVHYSIAEATESNYNAQIGAVYSYDEGRIVYDPLLGTLANVEATSLNTILDPEIAENEYNRYIAEQTANGFTVDTMNFVYISYDSLEAYCLSDQDESLLGIDVGEFYDMERTVGPNEYYTVDANGNLTKLEFPMVEDESKGNWLDRLFGAIISVGIIAVGVIIVATLSTISCGLATAASPYIMGAFIGAGMEVFMQTVIQGKPIKDINWLRVGIAAVSGVLSAIPGVGWFGAGMIQGVTEAAMTAVDGGSLEDVFKAFTVGFITGVVIHGVGKALSKVKFCFTAGTPVLMAAGYTKAIENIRPGDVVESYNQITGKSESKRVLQTFENETDEITKITTSAGETVSSTPGHKFYANNKWISAEDLRAGDILVNVNGQQVVVEQVQHEILENPIKVYNFEVADNNSYYVGREAGVLVHNAKCSTNFDNTEIIVDGKKVKYEDLGKTLKGKEYAYKFEGTYKGVDVAYVGKGTNGRVKVSMSQKYQFTKNDIKRVFIETATDGNEAFKLEAQWMNQYAKESKKLLNQICSPGFTKQVVKFPKLKEVLFGSWINNL